MNSVTVKRLGILALCLAMTATAAVTAFRGVEHHRQAARPVAAVAPPPRVTLVIDAGHGGEDGGAVSPGGARESVINLDVARRLYQLMGFFGMDAVMTRAAERIQYSESASTVRARKAEDQKNRLSLLRAAENAVLVSIHQNKYTSAGPFGAQVLFAPTGGSEEFAKEMQALLVSSLNPGNHRAAAKIQDSIYLMNNVKCPAVLIECGFLSNPTEEALLQTDAYRLKIAAVIAAGFLRSQPALRDVIFSG
ncbi:MAG: N-acetylmuramoyl-L-alanine amidase [Oscillospiraceae bacterium]|jgi:N-acetylmuramoyl-L-alanine amidase|nr:N-acetylmuramoyl-L-alanine amidase [Oscillospiraceae bacterium]